MSEIESFEQLKGIYPCLCFQKSTKIKVEKKMSAFVGTTDIESDMLAMNNGRASSLALTSVITELLVFSRCVSNPHNEEYVCLFVYTLLKGLSLNCVVQDVVTPTISPMSIEIVGDNSHQDQDENSVVEMDPQARAGKSHADYFVYDHTHQVQLVVEAKCHVDDKHMFQLMGCVAYVHEQKLNTLSSSHPVVTTYGVLCDLQSWKFVKFNSITSSSSSSVAAVSPSTKARIEVVVTYSRTFTLTERFQEGGDFLGHDFVVVINLICHIMGIKLQDKAKEGIMSSLSDNAIGILEAFYASSQSEQDEKLHEMVEKLREKDEELSEKDEKLREKDEKLREQEKELKKQRKE